MVVKKMTVLIIELIGGFIGIIIGNYLFDKFNGKSGDVDDQE